MVNVFRRRLCATATSVVLCVAIGLLSAIGKPVEPHAMMPASLRIDNAPAHNMPQHVLDHSVRNVITCLCTPGVQPGNSAYACALFVNGGQVEIVPGERVVIHVENATSDAALVALRETARNCKPYAHPSTELPITVTRATKPLWSACRDGRPETLLAALAAVFQLDKPYHGIVDSGLFPFWVTLDAAKRVAQYAAAALDTSEAKRLDREVAVVVYNRNGDDGDDMTVPNFVKTFWRLGLGTRRIDFAETLPRARHTTCSRMTSIGLWGRAFFAMSPEWWDVSDEVLKWLGRFSDALVAAAVAEFGDTPVVATPVVFERRTPKVHRLRGGGTIVLEDETTLTPGNRRRGWTNSTMAALSDALRSSIGPSEVLEFAAHDFATQFHAIRSHRVIVCGEGAFGVWQFLVRQGTTWVQIYDHLHPTTGAPWRAWMYHTRIAIGLPRIRHVVLSRYGGVSGEGMMNALARAVESSFNPGVLVLEAQERGSWVLWRSSDAMEVRRSA